MEIALSAFLGEVVHRSVSFFIDKLSKEATSGLPSDEALLRRKLLRVHVVVEEAEGRQIRNPAMLEQLKVLRAGMYRGYYVLDTFRYRASYYRDHNRKEDHGAGRHSFAVSKFNPAKRVQLCRGGNGGEKEELQQVIGSLDVTITDASEFIMFLTGCPPLYHRPYSTYLVLDKCMFSRHVEMEYVVNFLMAKGSSCVEALDVLPIVGPAKAGKSTLVEHVCGDERVRAAFSQIVCFTEDDLDKGTASIRGRGRVKHQNHDSAGRDEKVLVILEVNGDINQATWSSLYSTFQKYAPNGGKIIICSRSDKIARFGTAWALRVEFLSQEAYWYFFKALAFGSEDPDKEPKLTSMAMEIAVVLKGSFISGNIMARMLRSKFSIKFWRTALSCAKEVRKRYQFRFGAHPVSPLHNRKLVQILNGSNDYCLVSNGFEVVSDQDEAPLLTFQEVFSGSVEPHGKFDVVAWRSSIPPHYTYVFSCEIHKAPRLDVGKEETVESAT